MWVTITSTMRLRLLECSLKALPVALEAHHAMGDHRLGVGRLSHCGYCDCKKYTGVTRVSYAYSLV